MKNTFSFESCFWVVFLDLTSKWHRRMGALSNHIETVFFMLETYFYCFDLKVYHCLKANKLPSSLRLIFLCVFYVAFF